MNRHLEEADNLLAETAEDLNRLMDINPEAFLESGISKDDIVRRLALARLIVEDAGEDLQLFEEKATREQYTLKRFKKKYNYDPQKKTITVDGDTYKCNLDNYKGKTMTLTTDDGRKQIVVRQLMASYVNSDPEIYIDRDFFKLNNDKRRDAVLQHEVGHTKLHNIAKDNPHLKKDAGISPEIYMQLLNTSYKLNMEQLRNAGYEITPEIKKELYTMMKSYYTTKEDYLSNLPKDKAQAKLNAEVRKQMIKIAKKYENTKTAHTNFQEFEADRYAANRTSTKNVKKAVSEYGKKKLSDKGVRDQFRSNKEAYVQDQLSQNPDADENTKKKIRKDAADIYTTSKKERDETRHEMNKANDSDLRARRKALKDKDLQKSKIYK
jgi:hypothetical protein